MPVNAKASDLDGLRTYSSIGGCDIICVINGNECGALQSISVTISREKMPIYVVGRADPVGYSRGKRGIAGAMSGMVFNQSWLMHTIRGEGTTDANLAGTTFWASRREYRQFLRLTGRSSFKDADPMDESFREIDSASANTVKFYTGRTLQSAWYADQILPFNVVITGANEYGGGIAKSIIGCEILNEASGSSVDDIVIDESHTYIALGATPWMGLGFVSPRKEASSTPGSAISDILGRAGIDEAGSIFEAAGS